MISKEEVKHIADLARLELSEEEIKKMQKDLSAILDYFDLLKKSPKFEKESDSGVGLVNVRIDEVVSNPEGKNKNIISSFPEEKDGYIKVKTVL